MNFTKLTENPVELLSKTLINLILHVDVIWVLSYDKFESTGKNTHQVQFLSIQ